MRLVSVATCLSNGLASTSNRRATAVHTLLHGGVNLLEQLVCQVGTLVCPAVVAAVVFVGVIRTRSLTRGTVGLIAVVREDGV